MEPRNVLTQSLYIFGLPQEAARNQSHQARTKAQVSKAVLNLMTVSGGIRQKTLIHLFLHESICIH